MDSHLRRIEKEKPNRPAILYSNCLFPIGFMKGLKLLFSKNYWLYIFSLKKLVTDALSTIGTIWLFIEVMSFFSTELSDWFKKHWIELLIAGALYVVVKNWPKTHYCFKLKEKDISIQLSIGDLFSYSGDLVIPINTSF